MADDNKATACARRNQQLKRWADSDTNRESIGVRDRPKRVNFQDGCVFLAACSSGDKDEVIKLLARGADINTANVDGLTALHQACIDDKIDMVKFLVDNGADVDVCDNEGWTPLHATASCGFTDIAQYLISTCANIAAVNNDGDLPLDICEDAKMEKLLQEEMNRQGVDAEAARREEEEMMLSDANQWLNSNCVTERPHAKTGAVALHVAAAKGYIKVMHLLIQAKANVNIKDSDGWTPLHAAAHWGQDRACKILAENFCDMDSKNNAGQTAFDVADTELLSLLEELKKKQAMLRDKTPVHKDIIVARGIPPKRRTSVTRMSGDQKHNVVLQTLEQEKAQLNNYRKDEEAKKSSSSSTNDDSSSESETERQNLINKNTSIPHTEEDNAALASDTTNSQTEFLYDDVFEEHVSETNPDSEYINDNVTFTLPTDETEVQFDEMDVPSSPSGTQPSLASTPSVIGSQSKTSTVQSTKPELRKFGSTSTVPNETNEHDADVIPRSASTPRLACDDDSINKPDSQQTPSSVSSGNVTAEFTVTAPLEQPTDDRLSSRSSSYSRFSSPYSSFTRHYVPYYHRLAEKRTEKLKNSTVATTATITTPTSTTAPSISRSSLVIGDSFGVKKNAESTDTDTKVTSSLPSPSITVTIASTTPTNTQANTSTTTTSVSISTPTTTTTTSITTDISRPSSTTKRTFEPPKRDEETETQRKARARKARETRRSTQGISTEDIARAKALKQTGTEEKENKEKEQECDKDSDKNDLAKDRLSSEISKDGLLDTTVASDEVNLRSHRTLEERSHSNQAPYRRPRESELSTSSTPNIYSIDSYSHGQHNQRNVLLSVSDISNTGNSTVGFNRTSSFRNRFRNEESEKKKEEETKDPSKETKADKEKDSERRESSALKARRAKRERRSTGVINYNLKSDEESNSVSKEENESDDSTSLNSRINSGTSSRCVSTSDIPPSITDRHSRSDRPSSYAGLSKSTPSLDIDYKKLYENEKDDTNRLKKELDTSKRELSAMKLELERFRRLHEGSSIESNQQKREKRALERKLSELESAMVQHEKLKAENAKVKEENRALARVISKLSR
ncbi:protein phosphatase 1 regulatory subunit 12A isoform X2 [Octopus sinensis]|uniref:Protein phosphatase 1 regulatory subunit 12B n=1 Tax=Octopus sinensis TaxID=2607531 RepID=A0A7E6EL17_9MOLL|nr:protein phosphatase 1 regulatory subunit 12A isoform X2 [Octopus sinensis]